MVLEDGEVCLIETGARMHGGKGPYCSMLNREFTQIDLTHDLFFNRGVWEKLWNGEIKNNLLTTVIEVDLVSPVEGYLKKSLEIDEVKALSSFLECEVFQKGDYVEYTRDLVTSPGYYIFKNEY